MNKEMLMNSYKDLVRIRSFEEAIAGFSEKGLVKTPCHLYIGQEAIAVGTCQALDKKDYVFSFYRGHGHYLARGGDSKKMLAEIFCKSTGCSKGRGGSMHLISPEVNLLGSTAIVAGQIAPAAGAALGSKIKKDGSVTLVYFGEGATEEGVFSEVINFAALHNLPLIFICENNNAAAHMKLSERQKISDMYLKTKDFMPSKQIDGNNVVEVYETTKEAVEHARAGKGPSFIECMTFRWRGHVGPLLDIDKGLRTQQEIDEWKKKDPLSIAKNLITSKEYLSNEEFEMIDKEVQKELEDATSFAKESPSPSPKEVYDFIYADKE